MAETEQEREAKAAGLASATQAAAIVLADQRESKAIDLANDREAAAIALAEQRGGETARQAARIDGIDRHLEVVNGSIERTAKGLTSLGKNVADLTKSFELNVAIMADRAEVAARTASKQLDTRTFVIGLIGAVAAVIMASHYLHI
jgi:hypothetical protein